MRSIKGDIMMTYTGKRVIYILMAAIMLFSAAAGTVYADQPYRGTTKHKRSLRNASIANAENRYTDLNGQTQDTDKNTVSINFTSDMEKDMELYARAATYFDVESRHYPRSFMLDAGNYSLGSPYSSVFSQFYPGLRVMGEAGYDIAGIGASELQGSQKLSDMLNKAAKSDRTLPYVTSANIAGTNDLEKSFRNYGVNDYLDMNKYRTEIAVFSIVGEDAFNAAAPEKMRYEDAVESAKDIVAEIKKDEDADMIICLCSSGTGGEDSEKKLEKKIAGSVEDIDMIISAGSTTELEEPIKVGGTRIYSLAAGSARIGRIEYVIENNEYKYSGYSTVDLNDDYEKDADVMKELAGIAKIANKNYFAANGYASGQALCDSFFEIAPLSDNSGKKGDSPLGELIADAYRMAAIEDARIPKGNLIALASGSSATTGIAEGKVTVNSVYDMMKVGKADDGSAGQALTSFYLTGADLRILAEIAATASQDASAERLYFGGLSYKYNPHRLKNSRVYDITVLEDTSGSQIDIKDKVLYRIVTDKTTALSISGLKGTADESLAVVPKNENGEDTVEFTELLRGDDKEKPLKTWIAVSEIMTSFSEAGIPAVYKKPDGRMVYDESTSFSHVFKGEGFTLVTSALVALIGIIAAVVLVLLVLNLLNVKIGRKSVKKK